MRFLFLLLFAVAVSSASAQRTEPFSASAAKGRLTGTPYEYSQSYFEFIDSKNEFVKSINDSDQYILYFFIDDSLTELGIRVLSPIPGLTTPNKGNIATASYEAHSNELTKGFDANITLYKADGAANRSLLILDDRNYTWKLIAENDKNSELRDNKNPLIRLENTSIDAGLYMLSINSHSLKKLKGSFLLQIGTNHGVRINNLQKSPYLLK